MTNPRPADRTHSGRSRAHLLAAVLSGAWRETPPEFDLPEEALEQISTLLLGSGAAPLAWWCVRNSGVRNAAAAAQLHRVYREQALWNAVQETYIEEVVTLLRSAGIEAILLKGWTSARLYAEPGLRPYGDVDVYVRPDQLRAARGTLGGTVEDRYAVDFEHKVMGKLYGPAWHSLYARSEAIRLGETEVRVLSAEDQLAFLCVHFLHHGGWRPLWLCDVAAALETRPAGFDWGLCLGKDRRRAEWIACAIGLARQLLGAQVDDTPVADRTRDLPSWLIRHVYGEWERPFAVDHYPPAAMVISLRRPAALVQGLRSRWPDPIEATIRMRGPLNGLPRLPFQLGDYLWRAGTFVPRGVHSRGIKP